MFFVRLQKEDTTSSWNKQKPTVYYYKAIEKWKFRTCLSFSFTNLFCLGQSFRCNRVPAATNPDSPFRRLGHSDSAVDVFPSRVPPSQRMERVDNSRHLLERKRQKHFHFGKVWPLDSVFLKLAVPTLLRAAKFQKRVAKLNIEKELGFIWKNKTKTTGNLSHQKGQKISLGSQDF